MSDATVLRRRCTAFISLQTRRDTARRQTRTPPWTNLPGRRVQCILDSRQVFPQFGCPVELPPPRRVCLSASRSMGVASDFKLTARLCLAAVWGRGSCISRLVAELPVQADTF